MTIVVERRPGENGRCEVQWPTNWSKRHGDPPTERRALSSWIRLNAIDDELDRASVPQDTRGRG